MKVMEGRRRWEAGCHINPPGYLALIIVKMAAWLAVWSLLSLSCVSCLAKPLPVTRAKVS